MSTLTVNCPVTSTLDPFGVYANSFRVLHDGPDLFLDFCVYSSQSNEARLVSRLRVKPSFIEVITSRLETCLSPVPADATIYVMPEISGSQ